MRATPQPEGSSLNASRDYATLGELRELCEDLPDHTPLVVHVHKAHDPDGFYEPVLVEECLSVDVTFGENRAQVTLMAPEPRDFDA